MERGPESSIKDQLREMGNDIKNINETLQQVPIGMPIDKGKFLSGFFFLLTIGYHRSLTHD